jgi:hypothetical protein
MAARYRTAADVISHARRQADALVRAVNPGRDFDGDWFAPKLAEVTKAMVRRLRAGLNDLDRADLSRKVRLAWEAEEGGQHR